MLKLLAFCQKCGDNAAGITKNCAVKPEHRMMKIPHSTPQKLPRFSIRFHVEEEVKKVWHANGLKVKFYPERK